MTTEVLGAARFAVDPWDPGYGTALTTEALAEFDATSVRLDLGVELPVGEWRPLTPDPATPIPRVLVVADGVRRIDARVWVYGDDVPTPGIAASYATGVVRCDRGRPASAELDVIEVRRGLFSASATAPDITTSFGRYPARRAADPSPEKLSLALQQQLAELELELAGRAVAGDDDLVLVDGPLRVRGGLSRAVGYIKTHHTGYLTGPQAAVVTALRPGQRTPVFLIDTSWRRYSWYLRLPSRAATPWAGVARCEADPDLPVGEARVLADLTSLLLPPLAGVEYKDPRAPQNLVPIGGLEKLLRHRLGNARLLYRALRRAAHGAAGR